MVHRVSQSKSEIMRRQWVENRAARQAAVQRAWETFHRRRDGRPPSVYKFPVDERFTSGDFLGLNGMLETRQNYKLARQALTDAGYHQPWLRKRIVPYRSRTLWTKTAK